MANDMKIPLYEIPVPSTDLVTDAILCGNTIKYSYFKDGHELRSGISFKAMKAARHRSESACTAWHVEGAYDTLVKIDGSSWLKEIMTDSEDYQIRRDEKWNLNHFLIYLDGNCFEVISEDWHVIPEEQGTWT